MAKLTEGRKMFLSVMTIFIVYAAIFILFDDYERNVLNPLNDASDWHLLCFSLVVMACLAFLLHRYAHRMDERISREQAERQNQMRRQLTQNIAHELKTPVASILGYTETIIDNADMPEATKRQFVERAHTQAKRLTALLQDISILNQMDYAPGMLQMERVDVSCLVADIEQETALSFERRHMHMENRLPDGISIEGNPSLLYSIFRNLVDNALNYAGGHTLVRIDANERADHWQFIFSDTGVGVSAEHLSRLFERFYRVDKGRSRTMAAPD